MARAALRHGLAKPKSKAWTKDVVEKTYLESVKSAEAYVRLERELNSIFPPECTADLDELLMPLCQACWSVCEHGFTQDESGSLYVAARDEAQRLQKQLNDCALMAMKQVNASKSTYQHDEGDLGDETIQFFEPLKYIDQGTKDLVLMITADKVKQIAAGTLPNEQVKSICAALTKSSSGRGSKGAGDDDSEEEEEEIADRLRELEREKRAAQEQKKAAEQRLKDSELKAAQFQQQCEDLRQQAEKIHQEALIQQANFMAEAEQARESLREAEARLEEAEKVRAEVEQLRETLQEAEAKAAALSEELQMEREASAGMREELRKAIEAAEETRKKEAEALANVAAARKKAEELQAAYTELQATHAKLEVRASQLEQEAVALRAELAELKRRGNGISQGAQTTLKSSEVDSMETENQRLKVALEELRAKLGELMNECKKKGIAADQMDIIADTVGLKPLMQAKSVFEKLYEDAMLRVGRLEKLRQKYAAERYGMRQGEEKTVQRGAFQVVHQHSPAKDSPGVLEALQHSSIMDELPQPPRQPPSPPRRAHGLCSPSAGFASMMALASNSTASAAHAAPAAGAPAPFAEQRPLLRELVQVQSSAHPYGEKACGLRPPMAQAPRQPPAPEEGAVASSPITSAGLMFPPSWVAFNSALSGTPAHQAVRAATQQAPPAPAPAPAPAPLAPALPPDTLSGGGELARRLAASTSLPTLGRSTQTSSLRCPGGAMPRHPAGLVRDSGWR